MKITKLGHCCLIIEEAGLRIMTDPGGWTTAQNEIKNIDLVLITHEHADHLHIDSLKTVLKNNPVAKVITNSAVAKILQAENIQSEILEHGGSTIFKKVMLEGLGEKHAVIYDEFGQVQNTGYFIANRFFYPGDAFFNPGKPVEILALPVCGPWMKISEAIDYAKELKPKFCFPVHDGMLGITGPFHKVPEIILSQANIKFSPLDIGKEYDL